jgi:phosphate transport system substrate-binding protein
VQRIAGSIGYVEYAYALQNKMTYALLQNHDGHFIKPDATSFQAAAAHADWAKAPGFYEILTNEPGQDSWPITGATFILMHKKQTNPAEAKRVLDFFKWAYEHGDQMAESLDYIPMPQEVVQLIYQEWKDIQGPDGKPVY